MGRLLAFLYGVVSYLVFFVTFLYAIGFVGNLVVPKSIDVGVPESSLGSTGWSRLAVNALLLAIFAVQHSVMARPEFKRVWTRVVPKAIERSTYVLLSSLALILLFWQWRPMWRTVWSVENEAGRAVLWALFALGWAMVLVSTFLIDHFELFGLRQVWLNLRGREYTHVPFVKRLFYKVVRHPIMLGFIIAFWATPHMTVGHLLFAAMTTAYIVFAIQLEERDLVGFHGQAYEDYQREVSMLIPLPKGRR
ncbi:MAG: methanethiol S-methyltransferase [Pyrinomonadaceae bacterium]